MSAAGGTYDRERAARAGGFGADLPYGRDVAGILVLTVRRVLAAKPDATAESIVDTAVAAVADELHEGAPEAAENAMWLAAMHNGLTDMYADLRKQVEEARRQLVSDAADQQNGEA